VNCLLDWVAEREEADFAVVTDKQVLTIGDLLRTTRTIHASLDRRRCGARVLLAHEDLIEAVALMVALDGVVDGIGLLDPNAPNDVFSKIVLEGNFDVVVTSRSDIVDLPVGRASNTSELARLLAGSAAPAQKKPTTWFIVTSGTTGTPKIVSHTLAGLTRTTKAAKAGGGRVCWGLLYDYSRFAGLQVVLQSLLGGAELLAPSPEWTLGARIAFLADNAVTHLSATPTLWRKILMTPGAERLDLRCVTMGGEIADQRLLNELGARFPLARLIHIYASTEAGVGFSVKDGREGFPATYLDTPPGGIGLRIRNDILQVHNPSVERRYVGADCSFADDDGWVSTGDRVKREEDRVRFLGRASGTINVGGNKVQPEVVETKIKALPGVADARVFGRKNPMTGMLVAAEIEPREPVHDSEAFVAGIRSALAASLQRFEIPAIIKLVEQLQINSSGKMVRR
jgi:acyl-CoA synthetase (AMP-forming)/AMP-acid ligase II